MLNSSGGITNIMKDQEPILQIGPEPPLMIGIKAKVKRKTFNPGQYQKENNQA